MLAHHSIAVADAAPQLSESHTTLNSPNGGESLVGGSVFPIEWMVAIPHSLENWGLWYSTISEDGPWIDIVMNLPAGDPTKGSLHSYGWSVPSISANAAWVRVRMDNAGDDYFDVSDSPFSIMAANLSCDFSGNGVCSVEDLNLLLAEGPIAGGVPVAPGSNDQFDLDQNGTLNLADVNQWLSAAAGENGLASPYKYGDGDLDSVADGGDFIAWNANKFSSSLRWDHGNFNGDSVADGADFILWNSEKFPSSDSSFVPEPAVQMTLFIIPGTVAIRSARRQSWLIRQSL